MPPQHDYFDIEPVVYLYLIDGCTLANASANIQDSIHWANTSQYLVVTIWGYISTNWTSKVNKTSYILLWCQSRQLSLYHIQNIELANIFRNLDVLVSWKRRRVVNNIVLIHYKHITVCPAMWPELIFYFIFWKQ